MKIFRGASRRADGTAAKLPPDFGKGCKQKRLFTKGLGLHTCPLPPQIFKQSYIPVPHLVISSVTGFLIRYNST